MKIKRKALSLLSCLALLVSSIPSTAVFVSADGTADSLTYKEKNDFGQDSTTAPILFANGNSITVTTNPDNPSENLVTCEDGSTKTIPNNASIFAGSHNDDTARGPVTITIDGATINNVVWGGGMHKSHVTDSTIIVKKGSTVKTVQGGGAASNSAIKGNCADGCTGALTNEGQNSKCIVDKATITIEEGANVTDVFGGGEGYSATVETTVNIKGGENINFVGAGGSNGYTGKATVNVEGGHIGLVQSVNRGTMDSAEFNVSGGTIDKLYIGGEKEDSTVTGTITGATVNVTAGKVEHLYPGTSGGQSHEIDVSDSENFSVGVSSEAEVGLDETLQDSEILTCDHNLELQPGTPAECEAAGTEDSWKCKNCQKLFADEDATEEIPVAKTIDALGHKYSEPIQIVGCNDTTVKFTYAVCTRCNTYFEVTGAEPTYRKLTAADDQNNDQKFDQTDLATYGTHKDLEPLPGSEATCAKEGKTAGYVCKECGKTVVPQIKLDINPDNHKDAQGSETWGDWKAIDENSNKNGEYTPVTCTVDGWQYRECSQCGAEEYKEVKAPGHKWADDIEANRKNWTEKTCTTDGSYQLECTVCHELSKEIYTEKAEGHKLEKQKVEAPTCTTDGKIQHWKCSVCGALFLDSEGKQPTDEDGIKDPKLDHKDTTSYEAIAPTCRATGRNAYVYCKICDKVISINGVELETPATYEEVKDQIIVPSNENAHVYDKLIGEAKEPDCTETGAYAYFKCEVCENYYKITDEKAKTYEKIEVAEGSAPTAKDVEIAALGHKFEEWKSIDEESEKFGEPGYTPATCTENGYEYSICTVCGTEEQRVKTALGHQLGEEPVPEVPAKCTETGFKAHYQCSVCQKYFDATDKHEVEYEDLVTLATGHQNIEFVEGKEATCLTTGIKDHFKCSDCGQLFLETGTEKDHDATYKKPAEPIVPDKRTNWDNTTGTTAILGLVANNSNRTVSGFVDKDTIYVTFTVTGVPAEGAQAFLGIKANNGISLITSDPAINPAISVPKDGTYTVSFDISSTPFTSSTTIQLMYVYFKTAGDINVVQSVNSTLVSVTVSLPLDGYLKDATEADIVIPIAPHKDFEKVAGVESTCITTGNKEHYKCKVCGKLFLPTEDSENCDAVYVTTPDEILPDRGSWINSTVSGSGELKLAADNSNARLPITKLSNTSSLYVTFDVTGVPAGGARAFLKFNIVDGNNSIVVGGGTPGEVNPIISVPEDGTYTVCYNLLNPAPDEAKYRTLSVCIINLNNNNVISSTDAKNMTITVKNVNIELPETIYLNEATDAEIVTPIKSHLDTEYNAKVATAYDDVAATCTDSGWSGGKYCSVCGKVLEARTFVPAKGHNYNQGEVTKEATCTSDGLKTFTCQNDNCGSKYTEVIPATGHKYGEEGTVTKAATCTADGIKTFTCETCKNTYTEVIPATGHTEETITGKAATCSEYGLTDGTKCSVCNVILVPQTVLPKTAHTIVTDASVDATCTKTGLTEGTHCSVCNAVITAQAVVPKKPHTPVVDEAVAATCTKSGKTKGSHCEVCDGIIEEQVVIPALGHEYVNGVCAVCNEKQPNYEPPTQPTAAGSKVSVKVIKITQAKITNLKVKSKAKNKINVSWKKVANAKGYQIEVSKSSSFKPGAKVLTKTTKKLKLTIKNKKLKSKKTYYVRARAYTTYKAADGSTKTAYSNWNYVLRKVKIK